MNVAFLIYRRPDLTARVFEQIRMARPERLLLVADGPKDDGERSICAAARAVVENVNWPCEVQRNWSEVNLGCRRRVSSGLDWVFGHGQDREAEIAERRRQLAGYWVREFLEHKVLSTAVPVIALFYEEMQAAVDGLRERVGSLPEEARQARLAVPPTAGLLGVQVDVPGHRPDTDFVVEVCAAEEVVTGVLLPGLAERLAADVSAVSRSACQRANAQSGEGGPSLNDLLAERVSEAILACLGRVTLDQALEREAAYFWSLRCKGSLKAALLDGRHETIQPVIDALTQCYGRDNLQRLRAAYEARWSAGNAPADGVVLTQLVEGRLAQCLDWAKPYWKLNQVSGAAVRPVVYSTYHLRRGLNPQVDQLLIRLNPNIANFSVTTGYDTEDPARLFFFQMECIQPLHNLTLLTSNEALAAEQMRRERFPTPESAKGQSPLEVGHADSRFLWTAPYRDHSLFPRQAAAQSECIFALAEMLGYVSPPPKSRSNFRLSVDLGPGWMKRKILGRSLAHTLRALETSHALLEGLAQKCEEEVERRKVTDLTALGRTLQAHSDFYEKCSRRANRELYDALRQRLMAFAQMESIPLPRAADPTSQE